MERRSYPSERARMRPVPSANPEGSGLRSRLWRFAPPWSDGTGALHPARQGVLPEGLSIAAIANEAVLRTSVCLWQTRTH